MIGHVEHGGTLGEFQQVALRCEDVYLVVVEVHFELVHSLHAGRVLQHGPYVVEPVVHAALGLDALVSPVGCHAAFGYLVHALRPDLHLHPFLLGSQHGDVQALVAVGFRHRQPVAHALGVRGVHVGDECERLPARHLLLLARTVDDDADGEEVVDAFEGALLLLHLLPDAVYGLCTAFHVEVQSGLGQFLFHRSYKPLYIRVACRLRGVQFLLDVVVGLGLQVLQRQVFQLAFQLVESQLVGQRRIEVGSLFGHLMLGRCIVGIPDLSHQVHAVGYHDEDDPHVLGKREEQVAEVLALDDGVLLVQFLYAQQSVQYACHVLAVHVGSGVEGHGAVHDAGVEHDGDDGVASQSYLVDHQQCRLQAGDDGVQPEDVAFHLSVLYGVGQVLSYLLLVVLAEVRCYLVFQFSVERQRQFPLGRCEFKSFVFQNPSQCYCLPFLARL